MRSNPQWRTWLLLAFLAAALYGAAFATRMMLVPDVVPVAFAEEPQSSFAVQGAFLLLATEMIASLSGVLLLIAAFAGYLGSHRTSRAGQETGAS